MSLKEKYIDLNHEKIFYLENENKSDKNILFIHGNMYSSSCFIEIIKKIGGLSHIRSRHEGIWK